MRILLVLIVVAVSLVASTAQAQRWYGGFGNPYYMDNRASTPAESYARGMADMTRAAGQRNLLDSMAAGNYEEARSLELDNRLKATDTYFEMRRINSEARAAERRPPPSSEVAFRRAQEVTPTPLTATQLDPVTGQIQWPRLLMQDRYATLRNEVEALFIERSDSGGSIGMSAYQELLTACNQLKAQLRQNIRDYLPNDYITASNFIDSLTFAARFPTG